MSRRALLFLLTLGVGLALSSSLASAPQLRAVRAGGINVEPGLRPWRWSGANPDGWWCRPPNCNGVRSGTTFVDRELALAADLGVANVRVEFPWPLIEPARRRYDWRRADFIVRAARRRHVRLQPVLIYAPAWAAAELNDPPQAKDFSAFVRAVVRRYRGVIHEWEFWNEPDLDRYWDGSLTAYVNRVLIPGSRAVKSVDRHARVILAATQKPDAEWLEGIYRLGGGSSFDIVSYHDYSGDRRVLSNASILRNVLDRHGQSRKPLWLGEYGLQEDSIDDARQHFLIQAVMTESAPIALAQWYSLRDDYNVTCCPPEAVLFEPFGLVTHSYQHKRAYATYRALLRSRR